MRRIRYTYRGHILDRAASPQHGYSVTEPNGTAGAPWATREACRAHAKTKNAIAVFDDGDYTGTHPFDLAADETKIIINALRDYRAGIVNGGWADANDPIFEKIKHLIEVMS